MLITIIIPTYNEENEIGYLLNYLKSIGLQDTEIIVTDGGSTDATLEIAERAGITLLKSPHKGRAKQMNYAARFAKGQIFYFLHADSLPPVSFVNDIKTALNEDYKIGCYRFKFRSEKLLLKFNSFCTRFDKIMCRGGDQSLFITKSLFNTLQGYNENYKVMEDYDIIIRAKKENKFKIIPKNVMVSARKYDHNSYLKVNTTNFIVFMMFFLKVDQDKMIGFYRWMLNDKKSQLKY